MLIHEYHLVKESDFNSEFNSEERPEELEHILNILAEEHWRVVPMYVGSNGCYLLMEECIPVYEYQIIKGSDLHSAFNAKERPQELENLLNQQGKQGWQVVPIYLGANGCYFLMERLKNDI